MLVPKPLILFIDAYDSFSNNIISLLETTLDVSVRTIKIDNPALATDAALHEELRHYVAVVCGPGPGHPANEQDVGLMRRIWRLSERDLLPVLGICLGFQSLCLEFGAEVKRLKGPQHGIIRRICHVGERKTEVQQSIFHGVEEITATLYQSLCADIGQDSIDKDQWQTKKWEPSNRCPDLLPLAWAEHGLSVANDSGVADERVLVGVQHVSKPFWALQYHPESICTNSESTNVLQQWFNQTKFWNQQYRQQGLSFEPPIQGQVVRRESLLGQHWNREMNVKAMLDSHVENDLVCHSLMVPIPSNASVADIVEIVQGDKQDRIVLESSNCHEKAVGTADVRGRYSIIGLDIEECVRYEYTTGNNYLTIIHPTSTAKKQERLSTEQYGGIWLFLAQHLEKSHVASVPNEDDSPFWGGFMGYTTYELGLESIGVIPRRLRSHHAERPDLCFAWVTRSLVVDHIKNLVYVQELAPKSGARKAALWQDDIRKNLEEILFPFECFMPNTTTFTNLAEGTTKEQVLQALAKKGFRQPCKTRLHYAGDAFNGITVSGIATVTTFGDQPSFPIAFLLGDFQLNGREVHTREMSRPLTNWKIPLLLKELSPNLVDSVLSIETPQNEEYEHKVSRCQEYIRNGDSYELCLTDQTLITLRSSPSLTSWSLYRTLRSRQPAPFASYIRLGSATLVSASPERFLKYSHDGKCELRPMKGTVRKSDQVSTLAQATALLDIPKEKAENLMIVDLVRHDLHGVCGSGMVEVPRLMVVEEYASVFQMISIVQGSIPPSISPSVQTHMSESEISEAKGKRYTGLDVLAASLPPGSMTGAPKKRSCEILQEIEEGRDRGLYSGVVGYMDVAGRGDWSVTIRCMFKWDDEDQVRTKDGGKKGKGDMGKGGMGTEKWHVGAGGAVTSLSTPRGEREEMVTKLSGTLGLFRS
ncbi:related to para-aminobenzoic acid synthetase [Phialocephala subalpina]|uniref:aminodeoxychorismate synthase n=1 Tax=Phialocephala subalpina TaxID=576137 RepID=A0A1L7X581_9HELO|nr:related to para-aminobenzoic acid synthetase [Phialocephala subalpina]